MNYQVETVKTEAGNEIYVRVFPVKTDAAKGVCIIAPATGVAQYLYDDFAGWLTEQGYNVVTFDYDGVGLSVDRHVKYSKSDMLSWANNDCPAVLDFVAKTFDGQERIWIGHSVGGHMLGLMAGADKIDRAITVASGTGTWWYNAAPTKRVVWLLWFFVVPLLVPVMGYYPGDKLKILCNLPKGVMMQWRRWCLKEDYAVGYEGDTLRERFAGVQFPITAIAFSDDDMMSKKSIDSLHSFFTGTSVTRINVSPEDIGKKRIGHIGWHRKYYQELWDTVFTRALHG